MAELLRERNDLLARLTELEESLARRPADGEIVGALAECSFRLAVHPDTPFGSAVRLLGSALRHDATNPLYAFHLGRVHLQHGQTDRAATWLSRAYELCPTSHRVWCHIGQLQQQLNSGYAGDPRFQPNGLRDRAEQLRKVIVSGADDVDPALLDTEPPLRKQSTHDGETALSASAARQPPAAGPGVHSTARQVHRRLTDPGRCRWSGVVDLHLEQLLEAQPTQRTMREALPLLRQIAGEASRRPGGTAAFVISATQWLVAGYPAATVRRLSAGLTDLTGLSGDHDPSLKLLERLCCLCEAAPAEVPSLLAAEVSQGGMPPLLAAVLHRRIVLRAPADFKAVTSYRDARALLDRMARQAAEGDQDQAGHERRADEYIDALRRALDAFTAPSSGRPELAELRDQDDGQPSASEQAEEGGEAEAELAALEERARFLTAVRDDAWGYLNGVLVPNSASAATETAVAQAEADSSAIGELIHRLRVAGAQGDAELERIVTILAAAPSPPADLPSRSDAARNAFRQFGGMGNFARALRQVSRNLRAATVGQPVAERPPSEPLAVLLARLPAAEGDPAASASVPAPAAPAAPAREAASVQSPHGLAHLRAQLAETDQAMDAVLADDMATLEAYPPAVRATPELQALAALLHSRYARIMFRLGRHRTARRHWNAMLADDRLDLATLRNIAVCDTRLGDIAQSLSSWRSYAEALYYYSIIAGSPRPMAAERVELHRVLADSLGPRFLLQKPTRDRLSDRDEQELLTFLDSPGRVSGFVTNKLLGLVNERLALSSPTLTLGSSKSDAEQVRATGAEALITLIEELRADLPERIADAFCALAKDHIQDSLKSSASTAWLTGQRDPKYAPEREAVIASLSSLCEMKFWFAAVAAKLDISDPMVCRVDSLEQLTRLDTFPLAHSPDLAMTPFGHIGLPDADAAQSLVTASVCRPLIQAVIAWAYGTPQDAEDQRRRSQEYEAIVAHIDLPLLAQYRSLVDDPQSFYPEIVLDALRSAADPPEAAIAELRSWCTRFPRSTGPARWLATLLLRRGEADEAIMILDLARWQAFLDDGRISCLAVRIEASFARANACNERDDRSGVIEAVRQAHRDALQVESESRNSDERERAAELRAECEKALRQAGETPL
jgi:tetratricopeptide (TPR) repeat protein